jgi:hypothetical protein
MYKLAVLAVLLALSGANAFWTACGGTATTHAVTSPACTATRCTATRGQPLQSNTTISFAGAHAALTVEVTAFVLGIGVPLPIDPPDNNACNSLFQGAVRSSCPTVAGVHYHWILDLTVPANLPAFTNSRVQCELRDNFWWFKWAFNYFCKLFSSCAAWWNNDRELRRTRCWLKLRGKKLKSNHKKRINFIKKYLKKKTILTCSLSKNIFVSVFSVHFILYTTFLINSNESFIKSLTTIFHLQASGTLPITSSLSKLFISHKKKK